MKLIIILPVILLSLVVSCKNGNSECKKYEKEDYSVNVSTIPDSIKTRIKIYLTLIAEPDIHSYNHEVYRLVYAGNFSNTNTWLFQKKDTTIDLRFREYEQNNDTKKWTMIKETNSSLSVSDWEHLQYLIYKFDFWTEKQYNARVLVDGYDYLIEGHRPQAQICGKRVDQTILTNAPSEDGIVWLCDELISLYVHTENL